MHRLRIVLGFALFAIAGSVAFAARAQTAAALRFAISFPAARSAQPLDGRVLLFISDDGKAEPRTQTDQYRANSTKPIFGVDVDGLGPGADVVIDDKVTGWPARLKEIGPSIYNQAIADAQSYFTGRVADLEGVCHEPEFGFWPRS